MSKNYLNHIQTLRAISVILVFLFHSNLPFFSHGYLGVDIFFVISGYVITKQLDESSSSINKAIIKKFFFKRILRIVPAYIFIIGIFYLIYLFFGSLIEVEYFINKLKYILSFTTNIFYLNHTRDYFDNIFIDPINHTWSLSVEMQFYLLYPFVIYYLFEKNLNLNKILIIITLLITVTFFISLMVNNKTFFYFPLFRFWEFLLGGLAYYYKKINNKKYNCNISLIFFSIILLKIFFFRYNYFFLDLLIIILSTFFFLKYYNNNNILSSIFNNKILVNVGNISYSFYLWHLPIIYFYDLYFENKFGYLICFIITIFFSIFTYYFIENKFKNFKQINFKYLNLPFILIFVIITYIFTKIYFFEIKNFIIENNYLEKKFQLSKRFNYTEIKIINDKQVYHFCTDQSKNFKINSYNLREECLVMKNNEILTYIEGDSHTAIMVPLILESKLFDNVYYENHAKISYEKVNEKLNYFKKVIYVRTINSIDEFNIFNNNINNFNKNVIFFIITPVPNTPKTINPILCLIKDKVCSYDVKEDFQERNLNKLYFLIDNLKKYYSNRSFYIYHPYNEICPKEKCNIFNKENKNITHRDNNHLTIEGVRLLLNTFRNFVNNNPEITSTNY